MQNRLLMIDSKFYSEQLIGTTDLVYYRLSGTTILQNPECVKVV